MVTKREVKSMSVIGNKLVYTIKYEIELGSLELEAFIEDEISYLNGMGRVTVEKVEVEQE